MRRADWLQLGAGVASHVPGLLRAIRGAGATHGSDSARYCYSVWLRHLSRAAAHDPRGAGFATRIATVGEIGPGDSLGAGLASLLCGAQHYLALDVVRYAPQARNVAMLHELAALFRKREDIPGDEEYPRIRPRLDDYRFPDALLPEAWLGTQLCEERVSSIEAALLGEDNPHGIRIEYRVPWDREDARSGADFVFSQACLEHVYELPATYAAIERWLAPGGLTTHQIDLKSHALTREWDGHRRFTPAQWRILMGARPNLINREPLSAHTRELEAKLDWVAFEVFECEPETARAELAACFQHLSASDLRASGLFVVGGKLSP